MHEPNEDELHRRTVNEVASAVGELLNELRLGQARSYYLNADRELTYYLNEPKGNFNSLDEARTQSGYALSEFQQMGPQGLELYTLTSLLHMAILQEKLQLSSNQDGAKKNVELHIQQSAIHIAAMRAATVAHFGWDPKTLHRPITGQAIPGQLVIPVAGELRARQAVLDTTFVAEAYKNPKEVYEQLKKRVESEVSNGTLSQEAAAGLPPVTPGTLLIMPPK